ncbi:MAG: hypothetical protein FJ098_14250, partial [Deltaproteobacteria bacterium]|nr:hypothetical protein [Deltaproteobacteria bacterium]
MNETRLQRPVVRVPLSEEQKNPLKEAFHGFLDAWHAAEDHPAPAATVLVEAVRRLSEIYTARREESPFRNRRLLQARLHFFMPTDIPKIWLPLGELMARRPELLERPVLRLLDLGAGAGTASLGALVLLKVLGYRGTVRITAVEPDPLLRDPLLRALDVAGESLGIPLEVTHHTAGLQPWLAASPPRSGSREERWDLALALDVLTEALAPEAYPEEGLELARRLLRRLDPGGAAILVEPALREPSRRLSRLRDRLRAEGLPVFAPCLAEGPCPELAADGYCFHAIQVPLNAWLQKLGDLAGLRR